MNTRKSLFIALISLMVILACVVPGLPSASAPAPTADTGRLETIVAKTVSAAIAQTEEFVLPTTPLPSATPTPAFTETPTTAPSDAGSALLVQEDGSTFFTDERAGYSIRVPAGWLAVRINQQEYYDAWSLPQTADPRIQKSLLSMKSQDPNQFRLYAIDTQDGQIVNDIVTNLVFVWDETTNLSFESENDLQSLADQIASTTKGLKVTSVSLVVLPTGMTVGVIESDTTTKNSSGSDVTLYQKQLFFKAKAGTQSIVLTTVDTLKDKILPIFDAMAATITMLQ